MSIAEETLLEQERRTIVRTGWLDDLHSMIILATASERSFVDLRCRHRLRGFLVEDFFNFPLDSVVAASSPRPFS